MSEDEKKAIEIVQGLKIYYDNNCLLDEEEIEENETVNNAIDTLINLIEKQQNELEQEKEKNGKLQKRNDRQFKLLRKKDKEIQEIKDISEHDWEERCRLTFKLEDCISKNKIKEKIESIENMLEVEVCDEEINYRLKIEDKAKIEVLKELLEEN